MGVSNAPNISAKKHPGGAGTGRNISCTFGDDIQKEKRRIRLTGREKPDGTRHGSCMSGSIVGRCLVGARFFLRVVTP